jgi:hypothetical protein
MKRKPKAPPTKAPKSKGRFGPPPKPKSKPKRKERQVSKPKDHDHDYADEPIPGPDQGDQTPAGYASPGTSTGGPLVEPPPDHDYAPRERHPIEASLETIDETVRKSLGGEPGSGIFALLATVAAQLGVKLTPPPAPRK